MKYLLLSILFMHNTAGFMQNPVGHAFQNASYPAVDLIQVRIAPWSINLQRIIYYTDTCYAVQFRDQSAMNTVAIKTLDLETLEQLKFFKEGLITLKKGHTGDVAEFRNYTLKKVGTKTANTWYILSYDGAVTNFQEAQANRMIFIIDNLVANKN